MEDVMLAKGVVLGRAPVDGKGRCCRSHVARGTVDSTVSLCCPSSYHTEPTKMIVRTIGIIYLLMLSFLSCSTKSSIVIESRR